MFHAGLFRIPASGLEVGRGSGVGAVAETTGLTGFGMSSGGGTGGGGG